MILPVHPEDQAVSAAPEPDQIVEFLSKHNLTISKVNVRDWGGFEVGFSLASDENTVWIIPNQPRGWGFTKEAAASHVLKEVVNNPDFDNDLLLQFLTQEQLDELKTIV